MNLGDPVYLLRWLYLGGDPPPSPEPRAFGPQVCGPDRQFRDDLGCEEYRACGESP